MGGTAFGYSVWLDSTFVGSWVGDARHNQYEGTFNFPTRLAKGSNHFITILQDHMGYEEDWTVGNDDFKAPRGILSYSFPGSTSTTVSTWKVTGNLGGESVNRLLFLTHLFYSNIQISSTLTRLAVLLMRVVYMESVKVRGFPFLQI